MHIVGDLLGLFPDLVGISDAEGYPAQRRYLFLGDYVDRGRMSLEVLILFCSFRETTSRI